MAEKDSREDFQKKSQTVYEDVVVGYSGDRHFRFPVWQVSCSVEKDGVVIACTRDNLCATFTISPDDIPEFITVLLHCQQAGQEFQLMAGEKSREGLLPVAILSPAHVDEVVNFFRDMVKNWREKQERRVPLLLKIYWCEPRKSMTRFVKELGRG